MHGERAEERSKFSVEKIRDLDQFVTYIHDIAGQNPESLGDIESDVKAVALRLDERIAIMNKSVLTSVQRETIARSITTASAASALAIDYIFDLTPGIDLKYKVIAALFASPVILSLNKSSVNETADKARAARDMYVAMRQRADNILQAIRDTRDRDIAKLT